VSSHNYVSDVRLYYEALNARDCRQFLLW